MEREKEKSVCVWGWGGGGGRRALSQAVGRTGQSFMSVLNRSQMTSHCNGNHLKTPVSERVL